MAKRRKQPVPIMLLWSKREQARFSEAVEKLVGQVGDLEILLSKPRAKLAAQVPIIAMQEVFDREWEALEKKSRVDGKGGAQYRRHLASFQAAWRGLVREWILRAIEPDSRPPVET